jgi:hypothetical protein
MESTDKKGITEEKVLAIIKEYLRASAFTDKKVTDTPTDSLQVVNRKYVTMNGNSASRPTASVIGQSYYDTTIGKPIWWSGASFKDAAGNVV